MKLLLLFLCDGSDVDCGQNQCCLNICLRFFVLSWWLSVLMVCILYGLVQSVVFK